MTQDIQDLSRRERLLEAGKKLIAKKGFQGTSVRDIAGTAGVNVSMVSYYFGGKEQLYAQIVQDFAERIRSLFSPEKVGHLSPREKVRYYARSVMTIHRENPELARILHHEMNAPSPILDGLQETLFPHVFGYLYETFEEGIREGTFRSDMDPSVMSYSLASLVNFYNFQREIVNRVNPAFDRQGPLIIGRALDIFFEGVNAPSREVGSDEN